MDFGLFASLFEQLGGLAKELSTQVGNLGPMARYLLHREEPELGVLCVGRLQLLCNGLDLIDWVRLCVDCGHWGGKKTTSLAFDFGRKSSLGYEWSERLCRGYEAGVVVQAAFGLSPATFELNGIGFGPLG